MKELAIISGKGGTGKTTVAGAFAALSRNKVLADCDVDAADLHLLLNPRIKEKTEFYSLKKAQIVREECRECGLCEILCRFDAINSYTVDAVSCEGCAVCYHACPFGAIKMLDRIAGHWFISETRYGPMVHARLKVAEENSGKLVAKVREKAREIAEKENLDYIIIDGPPGIGCPVISTLTGVNVVLIVTEPTMSGLHDMERIIGLTRHFNIKPLICVNKYDLNLQNTEKIKEYCRGHGLEVIGRIPFDREVVDALVHGKIAVEHSKGRAAKEIQKIWERVFVELEKSS
jgi:MinD superfamily P-loop ATPase